MIDVSIYAIPFFFASAALLGYLFRWWYRDFYLAKRQVSGLSSSQVADQVIIVQELQLENNDLRKQVADIQSANKLMLAKIQSHADQKEQHDNLKIKIEELEAEGSLLRKKNDELVSNVHSPELQLKAAANPGAEGQLDVLKVRAMELEEEKHALQQTNEDLMNTVRLLESQFSDVRENANKKNKESADQMIAFEMLLAEKIKENDVLKQHNLELQDELNKLKKEYKSAGNNNLLSGIGRLEDPVANLSGNVKVQMNRLQEADKEELHVTVHKTDKQTDLKAAGEVLGTKVKWNDLKLIEGIGPKIEELFHKAGIKTWQALAETTVERCREILQGGGERFQMHNPGTWPRQSKMLASGKWKQLKEFQMSLQSGRVVR
jgi:predicted flap endonuclease-1-like 5' DNA nuclease/uncharacterized protein YlxW (UPF0749 family)